MIEDHEYTFFFPVLMLIKKIGRRIFRVDENSLKFYDSLIENGRTKSDAIHTSASLFNYSDKNFMKMVERRQ